MDDWDGLENRCTLTGTEGSNPSLSAKKQGTLPTNGKVLFLYPNDKCRKIGYLPIKFVACLSAVKQTLIVFFSTGQILYLIHTANLYLRISFMKYIQFILKNRKVIFH